MAGKFHNGKNGPAPCKANKRTCRYGVADHYDSFEDAQTAYENKKKNELFGNTLKKNTTKPVSTENVSSNNNVEFEKKMDDVKKNIDVYKKAEEKLTKEYGILFKAEKDQDSKPVNDAFGFPSDQPFDKVAHKKLMGENRNKNHLLNKKIESLYAEKQQLLRDPNNTSGDAVRYREALKYHAEDIRIKETLKEWDDKKTKDYKPHNHYSTNAGKLNPNNWSGSGSDYIKAGENSLVILAKDDGSGVRVISSSQDYYTDPENALGEYAIQFKQSGMSSDRLTRDLRVVGYVSQSGDMFGYVPNKQVSAFVYK